MTSLKYVDSNHAYYLNGKRCKGVSTCAKIGTDTYQLEKWQQRQVLLGVAEDPSILESVHDELYGLTYHDNGDIEALDPRQRHDQLVERALEAAGAYDAARAGTATHDLTDRHDRGEIDHETLLPHEKESLAKWDHALERCGFRRIPDMAERVIVYPDERICGRFDRIVERIADGKPVGIDLKTGESAVRYPHSTVAQIAMYVNAPLLADFGAEDAEVNDKFERTTSFVPMPEDIDKEVGYVIHMPADMPLATVHAVNLRLGWQACQKVIFPALRWRAIPNDKLIKEL